MTSRSLTDNSRVHPEHFDAAAAEAEKLGRFWAFIEADADRSAEVWDRYKSRGGPWGDTAVAESAFDPAFRVVLDSMHACRVSGITSKRRGERPGYPEKWLAQYATPDGRAFHVNVTAEGVADDLDAWWWLVMNADLVVSCDATRLDAATLFDTARGPTFMTTRYSLSATVLQYAKKCALGTDIVALVPRSWGAGWAMVVVAAPASAGALAREALRRRQVPQEVLAASQDLDVAILATMEASTYWSSGIDAKDFEKSVLATLKRGEKHPNIPRDAIRALAAAEGVAIAEGRARTSTTDGMSALVTSFVTKAVDKADPVRVATIELALTAVGAVLADGTCERSRWAGENARAQFRLEVEGLQKRLQSALATRRTRARAPNAVPLPSLREIPARPINWRTHWLHLMLDDVVALLAAIRDGTGAVPLLRMADRSHLELRTDWDIRERLATIAGCPFDERTAGPPSTLDWRGEWPKLSVAQRVLVWWPDVSPRPTARDTDGGWETVSWGHAELRLLGATPSKVLRSEWSYPTGTERKEQKFAGPGPWSETDWGALRRNTKAVASLISGTLGGVAPDDLRDTWTMPVAAQSYRLKARKLMGTVYHAEATLPE